jgi:hypothetical protein
MEPLGDQFLAGSAFADDQHGPVQWRGTARPLDRVEESEALPYELIGPFHAQHVVANPTIWQDISLRRWSNFGGIDGISELSVFWHEHCKSKSR